MAEHICEGCESAFTTMEALATYYKYDDRKVAKKYLKNTSC
jgi:hypothetical protein